LSYLVPGILSRANTTSSPTAFLYYYATSYFSFAEICLAATVSTSFLLVPSIAFFLSSASLSFCLAASLLASFLELTAAFFSASYLAI